ncbi:MAG: hypothetical protein AABZ55_10410 [Bdellovibrionota bacterium]
MPFTKTLQISLLFGSIFVALSLTPAFAAKEIWTITESMETPESAYYDPESDLIFVSNVAGAPDQKDGKGWISKISPQGKILSAKWVDHLSAPKGLRAKNGVLWVTNIDEVVSIEIKSARILSRVSIPDAKFLNDLVIGEDNTVYVSDTFANAIFQIRDQKPTLFVKGNWTDGPNGLLIQGKYLIVASWGNPNPDWSTKTPGRLLRFGLNTHKRYGLSPAPLGNLDGLELEESGNYLVSDWVAGRIFRVTPKGEAHEIFSGFKNSADIGYILKSKILLVPQMGANKVSAFTDF